MNLLTPLRKLAAAGKKRLVYLRTAELNGRKVRVPLIEGQGGENLRPYEPHFQRFLQSLLRRRPGTFVDVGVNLGQTLLLVATSDPGRRYIGFEISPFCCFYVQRLIAANGFGNCTVVPLGLSDEPKVAGLHAADPADPQATTLADFWTERHRKVEQQKVLLSTGDEVLSRFGIEDAAVVKIDVEGAESDVLAGLRSTVARSRPVVLTEVLPFTASSDDRDGRTAAVMQGRAARAERMRGLIREYRYVSFRVLPGAVLQATEQFNMDRYDETMTNYALLPEEQLDAFRAAGILAA